eukprot:6294617-Amphidinium_carterae.1
MHRNKRQYEDDGYIDLLSPACASIESTRFGYASSFVPGTGDSDTLTVPSLQLSQKQPDLAGVFNVNTSPDG